MRRALVWIVPLVGTAVVVAFPLLRYVQRVRAEAAATNFLIRIQQAQESFRAAQPRSGYATSFESLTLPCPGKTSSLLMVEEIHAFERFDYFVQLRAAEGATPLDPDCHGRPTSSDYYIAAAPRSVRTAGQQAFASTGAGRIFVFFDGMAPLERDMTPSGLATPLESLSTFKIP